MTYNPCCGAEKSQDDCENTPLNPCSQRKANFYEGPQPVKNSHVDPTAESISLLSVDSPGFKNKARAASLSNQKWYLGWVLSALIGIIVGALAYVVHVGYESLSEGRLYMIDIFLHHHNIPMAVLVSIGITVGCGLAAVACVLLANPTVAQSGIPGLIAFLNGIDIPHLLSPLTLVAKMVGAIFSVGGGLACGPEGPLIHVGAATGRCTVSLLNRVLPRFFGAFMNNYDLQAFVAMGAGCGIAAAFRAPIAGTLFVVEEAASQLSVRHISMTFFACMAALYTTRFIHVHVGGNVPRIEFQEPANTAHCQPQAHYIFIYIAIGTICGVFGGVFNRLMVTSLRLRKKYVTGRPVRMIVEVVLIAAVCATVFIAMPSAFACRHRTPAALLGEHSQLHQYPMEGCMSFELQEQVLTGMNFVDNKPQYSWITHKEYDSKILDIETLSSYNCEENAEFNGLASLFAVPIADAVRNLFMRATPFLFSPLELIVAFFIFFVLSLVACGSHFPAGLVTPMMFLGGCVGRLVGMGVFYWSGYHVRNDPGVFAAVGAAAFMGGSGRIMLFLATVMLEITSDLVYLPGIVVGVVVAGGVSGCFSEGLYHELIHENGLGYLGETLADVSEVVDEGDLRVGQLMAQPVLTLQPRMTVGEARIHLKDSQHQGFPVVDRMGRLLSLLERSSIGESKDLRHTFDPEQTTGMPLNVAPHVRIEELASRSMVILRPDFSLEVAYDLFTRAGCRHAPVIDDSGVVVGMITRKDLLFTMSSHE